MIKHFQLTHNGNNDQWTAEFYDTDQPWMLKKKKNTASLILS